MLLKARARIVVLLQVVFDRELWLVSQVLQHASKRDKFCINLWLHLSLESPSEDAGIL